MTLKQICTGLALSAAALIGAPVLADTTIIYVNSSEDGVESGKTQISGNKVKMSSPGGDGYAIYNAENNQFVVISDAEKTYSVMDQATIQKIADMQKKVMQEMEAQLQAMPPAQREQMKKMMSSMMPKIGGEPSPRSYERTGESRSIAGYDCEVMEVYAGERKASEQCVITADELDIPGEDYASVQDMTDFFVSLSESFGQISDEFLDFGEPGRDEIPLQYTHYGNFTGTSTGQMKSILHDSIDPSVFEIPAGYKEQKMPELDDIDF